MRASRTSSKCNDPVLRHIINYWSVMDLMTPHLKSSGIDVLEGVIKLSLHLTASATEEAGLENLCSREFLSLSAICSHRNKFTK
jgi:hypothetical protein